MLLNKVNSTGATVEIHPYVLGRLRSLPREEEAAGILLGTSINGVTHVTGFRRVPGNALGHAADEAGSSLAGFYRLQTPGAPSLLPEEEELQLAHNGSLFLLVKAMSGAGTAAEATVWTRGVDGALAMETFSLGEDWSQLPPQADRSGPILRLHVPAVNAPPWRPVVWTVGALAVIISLVCLTLLWLIAPTPELALDLQSRPGELTAKWEQKGTPKEPLQSATLAIRDGDTQQTIDLTSNYTPKGHIVIRPRSRDIVMTLQVQYAGMAPVSTSATYAGFVPVDVTPKPPPPPAAPDPAELNMLRRRNKDLEDAIAALRKRLENENGPQ